MSDTMQDNERIYKELEKLSAKLDAIDTRFCTFAYGNGLPGAKTRIDRLEQRVSMMWRLGLFLAGGLTTTLLTVGGVFVLSLFA